MPFCSNCGTKIEESSRFCGSCGSAVVTGAVPQAANPPPRVANKVITMLPQAKKMKMMGLFDSYTICFTDRQTIIAKLTNDVVKDVVKKSQEQSKSEGKGMFARVGAQMKAFYNAHLRYLEMTPEQILVENPANIALENAAINVVKIKRGFEAGGEDGPGDEYVEVEFESSGNKYKYRVSLEYKDVYEMLERFFPGKIRK
jgi:hypothetical protein